VYVCESVCLRKRERERERDGVCVCLKERDSEIVEENLVTHTHISSNNHRYSFKDKH
jgi:hypothetical protein